MLFRSPKYWSFSFSISPSNEYSGLISFRIDGFDLLQPKDSQGSSPTTQFKSINSLVLSLLYGPTLLSVHDCWKNFAPRSKCLFNLMAASPSPVILEPKKIKPVTISTFPPSICQEVMGPDTMILIFLMLSSKPAF